MYYVLWIYYYLWGTYVCRLGSEGEPLILILNKIKIYCRLVCSIFLTHKINYPSKIQVFLSPQRLVPNYETLMLLTNLRDTVFNYFITKCCQHIITHGIVLISNINDTPKYDSILIG